MDIERIVADTIDVRFGGFYETFHGDRIKNATIDIDEEGNEIDIDVTYDETREMEDIYCKEYINFINEEFDTKLEFLNIDRPREYNFRSDVIIAKCTNEDMDKIIKRAYDDFSKEFDDKIIDVCTTRPGYWAFYTVDNLLAKKDSLASIAMEVIIDEELDQEWEQYFDLHCVYDNLRI